MTWAPTGTPPMIIGTTVGFYYKMNYADTWHVISGVTTDSPCQWNSVGQCAAICCKRNRSKTPIYFVRGTVASPNPAGASIDKQILTSAYNSNFGTANSNHSGAEHGGRLLISIYSTIWYSNPLDHLVGLDTNYVNVGNSNDHITGLQNINGTLFVLKKNSIWYCGGSYSDLTSQAFRQLISGCGSSPHVYCEVDGKLCFGNPNGLWSANGSQALLLSRPVERKWQSEFDEGSATISFNSQFKWIIVKLSSSKSDFLIYDLRNNQWYCIDAFSYYNGMSVPTGDNAFIYSHQTATNVKNLTYSSSSAEATQELQTKFTNFDNPFEKKYLSRIAHYGTGVTNIKIYTRDIPNSSGTLAKNIDNPEPWEILDLNNGKEVSVKFTGAGSMILGKNGVAIEYERRRI